MKGFWQRVGLAHHNQATLATAFAPCQPASPPLFRIGCDTARGADRIYNEDSFFFWSSLVRRAYEYVPLGFCIVADGMGGQADGERASEMATRIVAGQVLGQICVPFLEDGQAHVSPRPINEVLVSVLEAASSMIYEEQRGAGTTLTAALLMGQSLFLAHAGDSRAYLFSHGKLERLTEDHSLVGRLLQAGAISAQEALQHPQRNLVYRSLGQAEELRPDCSTREFAAGDRLLLCTDGIWSVMPDEALQEALAIAATPHATCERLVSVARERGSDDDATAILVEWGEVHPDAQVASG